MTTATVGAQLDLDIPAATMTFEVQYVPRESVFADPTQPRTQPDQELRDSIRTNGMLTPISVRQHPDRVDGSWMIIDGERRWRGAEDILEHIPVIVRSDLSERPDRLRTQLVANNGKALSPLEEARAYAELMPSHESVASLARALGRPERSVAERLHLLELGPWVAWIETGRIPMSHAVKSLIAYRGCPDEVHTRAMAVVEKDYHFQKHEHDGETSISSVEFERVVERAYGSYLYPLTKTKADYDRQPTFDTKSHDLECSCGRIQAKLRGDNKRACCGNPEWWRSRDRKAKADAPKKKSTSTPKKRAVEFHLPEGAKAVTTKGFNSDAEKAYTPLTKADHNDKVRWSSKAFDAPSLAASLDPKDLVLVRPAYGAPFVATTNATKVKAAREVWIERWSKRRETILEGVRRRLKEKGKDYAVRGPGVGELLAIAAPTAVDQHGHRERSTALLLDAFAVSGVDLPKGAPAWWAADEGRYRDTLPWLGGLEEKEAGAVSTALAFMLGTRTESPTEKVLKEMATESTKLGTQSIPWTKAPKPADKGKRAKTAAAEEIEDEEDVEDDE